jgi:ammonia channel protein AmtB
LAHAVQPTIEYKHLEAIVGLRVSKEVETIGFDLVEHGEEGNPLERF